MPKMAKNMKKIFVGLKSDRVSLKTVYRIVKQIKDNGTTQEKPRPGRLRSYRTQALMKNVYFCYFWHAKFTSLNIN